MTRRGVIAGIGGAGIGLVHSTRHALGADGDTPGGGGHAGLSRHLTAQAMKSAIVPREGEWAETLGFHSPGDGGAALYRIQKPEVDEVANEADVLALRDGFLAVLHERRAVNYKMFGAVGDGKNDDGVQIKLAHAYANRHQIPVVHLSGEFWIVRTNAIPITTPVQWGKTVFHIDERYNRRTAPRFVVQNDRPAKVLTDDTALRDALLGKLKPGVQIIDELAPYAGHLMIVQDTEDRIGIRAGYAGNRGWAREELFYVEEEGRILGDIAWGFRNFTSIRAIPCNDNYLVIQGGGFHFSGDTPQDSTPGYHQNGIAVQRSRTIIREQWMGLEPGRRDLSVEPRNGLYVLGNVYDVTLENIRAMPWEKSRRAPEQPVAHGTYGIGGARMLNCTFRNVTADAGWISWGVFGTNLNKNFRLENCRLNRVDVHFHCWNLSITDCTIGLKGISVTGGGELVVENTTRHGNTFISFRPDYGAKWDGPIRLRNCTLKPSSNSRVSVLSMRPSDFDYRYPIGLGTSVSIEDLRIDYAAAPTSGAECWLMDIAAFSRTQTGQRLFFPHTLIFRNVTVEGRQQGVRLLRIADPGHYDVRRPGVCDDSRIQSNCILVCDKVQLEKTHPARPGDVAQVHLQIGGASPIEYADQRALVPKVIFTDCENVTVLLSGCAASAFLHRCSVNAFDARDLRGELAFSDCRFQPDVRAAGPRFYSLDSTLGTRLTNCTIHAPIVDGRLAPEMVDRFGFVEINQSLRHYHLNTGLSREVVGHLKATGVKLAPEFVARLKANHELDE